MCQRILSKSSGTAIAEDSNWSVTIPAKTGGQDNDTTHWYVGDGTGTEKYIAPAKDRSFTVAPIVGVTGVSLDKTSATVEVGNTVTLNATITPDNATNKNVTWTSSDESVATVNNGTVSAIAAGTATITVTTEDGNKTATCSVTVTAAPTTCTVTFDTDGGIGGKVKCGDDEVTEITVPYGSTISSIKGLIIINDSMYSVVENTGYKLDRFDPASGTITEDTTIRVLFVPN